MLTLVVAGMEAVTADSDLRYPALERLIARGQAQALARAPWEWLAELAGFPQGVVPAGPVSALGEIRATAGRWFRVEPVGAELEREGIFGLRAAELGISPEEAEALATSFRTAFSGDGLELVVATPCRWYLCAADADGPTASWCGFSGPPGPLAAGQRPAPPEPGFRTLLSETEILFHAHPVNVARRERLAPVIAGLHPWGGGRLPAESAVSASDGGNPHAAAHEDPFLAGLRRLGALPGVMPQPNSREPDERSVAWPIALESCDKAALDAIEHEWVAPALGELQRGRIPGIRLVSGRQVITLNRAQAMRFWRRTRPPGDGW